jgi:hypothetical protein
MVGRRFRVCSGCALAADEARWQGASEESTPIGGENVALLYENFSHFLFVL